MRISNNLLTNRHDQIGPSRNPGFDGHLSLAQQVISSPSYQDALTLFNNEPNKIWLQRLQAIPYSAADASETFLDDIGLSNNYNDKQAENYRYCMQQISALVEQYQQWKNDLPVEQVRQDAAAGINSAITGNVVGSDISQAQQPTANPASISSTNVAEFLNNTANFLLSAQGGFADIALKFRDLRLRENKQSFDIDLAKRNFAEGVSRYMRENGILPKSRSYDFSYQDITYDNLRELTFVDPKGKSISLENLLDFVSKADYIEPLLAKSYFDGRDFVSLWGTVQQHGNVINFNDKLYHRSIGLNETVKAQYELHKLRLNRQLALEKYNSEIAKYSSDSAEYNKARDGYLKDIEGYKKQEQKIRTDLIERLSKSNNEDDMLLLSKILTGYNYDDIDILNTQADFGETQASMGVAGQLLNILGGD